MGFNSGFKGLTVFQESVTAVTGLNFRRIFIQFRSP